MRIRLIPKARCLFLILVLSVAWSVRVSAQEASFVQVTDPHLFDGGQEGTENKAALAACVKKLNERIDEHANYMFAVLTGDIGVEKLVSTGKNEKGESILEPDQAKREQLIGQGAAEMASILSRSRIRVWLFLPGNNDLLNEEPDTQYYRLFVKKLQNLLPNLEIIDLCPEETNGNNQQLGVYRVGSVAFIGFNNASFKNNNELGRVALYKDKQLRYVRQVSNRMKDGGIRSAYIFYHIPELDDPYIVLDGGTKRPSDGNNPYPLSSWFVDKEVHDEWKNQVLTNEKVRGLFAGHYHDWRRDTYLNYHWMQTADFPSAILSKLYICPPLAIKRQDKTPSQARGFQEVTIDGGGTVSRTIIWFNAADQIFDTDPSSISNELELALFYEREHQWPEAESHFREAAAKAESTNARNAALAGLKRVKDPSHPWANAYRAWTDPSFLAPFVVRPLGAVAVIVFLWIFCLGVRESSRGMVIHPFEGDDELAKLLLVSFPATRARILKILGTSDQVFSAMGVYPFVFPRMNELLPQESFELAGIKVPNLNILLRWLLRPRFQVTGGFSNLLVKKYVYAEVWRRRWWFGTRLAVLITREISSGYYTGRVDVETFIFDVYLKANATL